MLQDIRGGKGRLQAEVGLPYPKNNFFSKIPKTIFSNVEFNADHFICIYLEIGLISHFTQRLLEIGYNKLPSLYLNQE